MKNTLTSTKLCLKESWFFMFLLIFIIGFFITPERSLHRNGYYLILFLPATIILIANHSVRNFFLKNKLFLLIFFFLIYTAFSILWSEHKTLEDIYDVFRYFLLVTSFPVVIFLAFQKNYWSMDDLLWWSMIGVGIAATASLILFYAGNTFPYARVEGLSPYTKVQTTSANMYGLYAIVGLCFFIQKEKRTQMILLLQLMTLIMTTVLFFFLIFSQTRGALIAFLFTAFIMLFLNKNWKAILLLTTLSAITITFVELSDSIRGFFERGPGPRISLWLDSLSLIAEKPMFGHGHMTYYMLDGGTNTYKHPHNVILDLTLKYGLFGLGLWSLITGYAMAKAIYVGKMTRDWTLAVMLIFSITAMMFTNRDFLASPNPSWIIYWLPVGLALIKTSPQDIYCNKITKH